MASTSNAENFMKISKIVYQLCDYTHFRADFLQTRICGEWLVYAERVTYGQIFYTLLSAVAPPEHRLLELLLVKRFGRPIVHVPRYVASRGFSRLPLDL